MTPRYATRTPSRGATSFQRFRTDEASIEERAFWDYATLPMMADDDGFDAERMLPHDEFRVLSKASSGGGFLVPTDLAGKVTAATRAASTVAGLAQEFLTADGQTFNVALDAHNQAVARLRQLERTKQP